MGQRRWKIGELAAATGLTVRALRHFDDIGLLCPAGRSPAGHRWYTDDDVRRLYRIVALRQLGIPLSEIVQSLDGDVGTFEAVVRAQLAHVDQHLRWQRQLRYRLGALLRAVEQSAEPAIDELLEAMENMMDRSHFTPNQLARAKQRHQEPGFARRFAEWQVRCAALAEQLRVHLAEGTDPADPAVQALATRWQTLMDELTEGDRATLSSVYARIEAKGAEAATRGALPGEVWDYLRLALVVGYGS
ncbi:MerR family transcriptional regulator [Micromonospora sp. NPDC049559]|uniref:MerR family transcriptional regulator n=1 Tax=Micromonospora sp. NPDC049559 TaxID=3155923 RepID=UPI00341DED64